MVIERPVTTRRCPIERCEAPAVNTSTGFVCGLHGPLSRNPHDLCASCGSDDPGTRYGIGGFGLEPEPCEDEFHS